MPLPISHGLTGASIVAALHPDAARQRLPLLAGAFLANCADFDFALVWLTGDKSWHRGFTHSLPFAALLTLALLLLFGLPRARAALAYGLAYASHALLDFTFAKHGGGVELFWPFSDSRTRLNLLGLSEMPSRMSPLEILLSLLLELLIFSALFALVRTLRRRTRHSDKDDGR
ncbi:MAG TPA: metal-dependent hydrolase [Pyrinomonadaceae bacterium]|nr:metal-dependent hydrolase [Pyrinomonadaceae bacterium]